MRRLLAAVLLPLLLAGCSIRGEAAEQTGAETGAAAPESSLSVELEHPVYDPSLGTYTYFIRNATKKTVEFGEPYGIQRREGDRWVDLTMKRDCGFTDIEYSLASGETAALTCRMEMFEKPPEEGDYRLVKSVDGHALYAEFRLAETPYGFLPLEDLPEDYGADTAGERDTVFTGDGIRNPETVEEFLFKTGVGAPCQLRTVQDYGGGSALVTDICYENGHYLLRTHGDDVMTERRFSYLVTDGESLYLSNGADWASGDRYGDRRVRLIPEGVTEEMAAGLERRTAERLEGSTVRYRVWSAGGERNASVTDVPTEFGVEWRNSGGSGGRIYDLHDWDGTETGILHLAWQRDGALLLECETLFGRRTRYLLFNPETEQLTAAREGLVERGGD